MEKSIKRYMPIFVLPTFFAFILGFIVPFIMGIWLSFCKFTTVTDAKFVGFSNYIEALKDTAFRHSFWYTVLFAIASLLIINIIAFALAMALTKEMHGTNVFRTVFFMPNLIGGIVLGYIWQLIFNGVLSRYGTALALNEWYGFWGLIILVSWQQIGYMMIIYIAGLQSIPGDVIEAAEIDGANKIQTLFKVTIPMMMPSITICMFLSITNGFKLFDQNLSLTAGEPSKMSEMMALNIFNTFYGRTGWEGVGQAKAVIFFAIVVVIGMIQLRATRSKVPFIMGIWLSFCKFTTVTDAKFVGFSNYIEALKDTAFRHSFWYTVLFAIASLLIINIIAFALAMALTKEMHGTNVFRTVFFMPNLIGGIVLGYIWQLIFNGVLSRYGTALALNEWYGFWGLIILVSWQQIGYMMIIYIAGLQSIPGDVIEAAEIDGANKIQTLFKVTIPMMMPSITICMFLSITNGFKLFDQNLSLTAGEPSKMSEMMALNIFNTFYGRTGWEGVGQAKAVIFFAIVVVIGMIQLRATRSKEVQQ